MDEITEDNGQQTKEIEQNEILEHKYKDYENITPNIETRKYSLNKDKNEKLKQIRLLQEKIDSQYSLINEFDNQIDQLKSNENKQIKKNKKVL